MAHDEAVSGMDPKRSLSDICEELCPGVKARNAGAFTRDPDTCMHGIYIHSCLNPTCTSISKDIARKRKEEITGSASDGEMGDDNSESWHNRASDRMAQAIANLVHLGRIDCRSEASDAMLDYMGKKGVPAPTVTSIFEADARRRLTPEAAAEEEYESIIRNRLSTNTEAHAPALKAQEGENEDAYEDESNTCARCHCTYSLTEFDCEPTEYCDKCAHDVVSDLASLAKKLTSALRAVHLQLLQSDNDSEYAHEASEAAQAVLAEANKAGCA